MHSAIVLNILSRLMSNADPRKIATGKDAGEVEGLVCEQVLREWLDSLKESNQEGDRGCSSAQPDATKTNASSGPGLTLVTKFGKGNLTGAD